MKKEKIELFRKCNVIVGYGLMLEPIHDIEEEVFDFCNNKKVNYCMHKVEYKYEPYTEFRYVKSGPWSGGNSYKYSHEYFSGCEWIPQKIQKPWKFCDYVKYLWIYYE